MKRFIASFLSSVMLLGVLPGQIAFAEPEAVEIYVATDGDDKNTGSINDPLATLEGARIKVSQIKSKGIPINVYFRGGEYSIKNTVKFDKNDSGTKGAPVTYMAYGDEKPVFTGGIKIKTEDFERVSNDIYERLPEESRDYVGVVDLKKLGVNKLTVYDGITPTQTALDSPNSYMKEIRDFDLDFYFNNRPMTLAEWPNGRTNKAKIQKVPSNWEIGIDSEGRMKNWVTAEHPVLRGMLVHDWNEIDAPIKDFDVENDILIFQKPNKTDGGYFNQTTPGALGSEAREGRIFQIRNLIEELDVPGEYWVDTDNNKLYFYPPYSTVDIDMTLACGEIEFVKMKDTEYVDFKNLTFAYNRESVIELTNTNNIQILGCDIYGVSRVAIELEGQCHNTLIDGCDFKYLGQQGVRIGKIHKETIDIENTDWLNLNPQNNIVNNSSFWDFSNDTTEWMGAININGVGNGITNCRFHNSRASVIFWTGNDLKVNNNEFYGVQKVLRDQGVIYNGRTIAQRGIEIGHNYFHDNATVAQGEGYSRMIYFDDCSGGGDIHHNLIYNCEQAFSLAGGTDTRFNYNIIVGCVDSGAMWGHGYDLSSKWTEAYRNFVWKQLPDVYAIDEWDKYPNLKRIFWGRQRLSWGSNIDGNIFYKNQANPSVAGGAKELGLNWSTSIIGSEDYIKDMFNDPQNGDYTIKSDYKLKEGFEPLKDINLSNVGIYESEYRNDAVQSVSNFRLYYPHQYADNLLGTNTLLRWEDSINADNYEVEIAIDENFENIVGTYETMFPWLKVDDLDNDSTEYFWRVTAIASGKDCKERKLNDGGPRRFRTQAYDILETTLLEDAITKAEKVLPEIKEGTEVGLVELGSKAQLQELINSGKDMIENKKCLQSEIDVLTNLINRGLEDILKSGAVKYDNIDHILAAKDSWVCNSKSGGGHLQNFDGGVTVVNNKDAQDVYTNVSQPIESGTLYCFKINVAIPSTAGEGVWQAISFQTKANAGNAIWSNDKLGYMFLIKNTKIEVQIWDGTSNEILVVPNTLKVGDYSDVRFGVQDMGICQRIVLEIDGERVVDHIQWENLIRDELFLTVWGYKLTGDSTDAGPISIMQADPIDVPMEYITTGSTLSLGNNDIEGVIKAISSSGEICINSGYKVGGEILDNLKAINFNIKPQLGGEEQGVLFRTSSTDFDENESNYYMLSFKSGKLMIKKNNYKNKETLAIIKTDKIKSGDWNKIRIVTYYENDGLRIRVYKDNTELINAFDSQPISEAGYFGVFNKTGSQLFVKP